jgi:hypothetical protein
LKTIFSLWAVIRSQAPELIEQWKNRSGAYFVGLEFVWDADLKWIRKDQPPKQQKALKVLKSLTSMYSNLLLARICQKRLCGLKYCLGWISVSSALGIDSSAWNGLYHEVKEKPSHF